MQIASLVIPLLVILLAALTKRLIPSLFLGLLAGGFVLAKGRPLPGLRAAAEHVISALTSGNNIVIVLMLFLFGAIAEIIKASGGIKGFVQFARRRVKTERGVYASVWLLSPVSFIDCCFHAVATGTVARPLLESVGGNRRRLASVVNITSCLLIILIPFGTTYSGYIVGIIGGALSSASVAASPYALFVRSIPFNFFAILMTLFAAAVSLTGRGFNRKISSDAVGDAPHNGEHDTDEAHKKCVFEQNAPPRIMNLVLPLAFLIAAIVYFLWQTGSSEGAPTFFTRLRGGDFERSIFFASALTLVLMGIYYRLQKMPLRETEAHFIKGCGEMMPPVCILVMSWGLSSIIAELGFADVVSSFAIAGLPTLLLPAAVYLICCAASYFMGSAWGTWALVMPVAVALAARASIPLPIVIGAVLSGGALGDNASPLGETAVLSAAVTGTPLMEHIKSQLRYSLTGVGVSTALFVMAPLLF